MNKYTKEYTANGVRKVVLNERKLRVNIKPEKEEEPKKEKKSKKK